MFIYDILSIICIKYRLIVLIYELITGKRFILCGFCYTPNLFLMELIIRRKKMTLLIRECRKLFKGTVISSLYYLASGRCISKRPIHLLNILNTRSYFFQNTYNIFCKNTIFRKFLANNTFFVE